jgi:hypothetical protein
MTRIKAPLIAIKIQLGHTTQYSSSWLFPQHIPKQFIHDRDKLFQASASGNDGSASNTYLKLSDTLYLESICQKAF